MDWRTWNFCFSFQFPDLLLEWLLDVASVGPGIDAKLSSANLTSVVWSPESSEEG